MGLFGKTPEKPPKELVNEWSLKIRKEMRVIDRQIRDIQREEEKVKRSIKDAAKKGQKDVCVILAKELIRSRKAVSKLYASKAHMNSVLMGMKNQLAVLRVAGSLQKSTEVMKAMQNLVKIPEIQATMRELSKEMMKQLYRQVLKREAGWYYRGNAGGHLRKPGGSGGNGRGSGDGN
ncbi:charged multivesicular body protein 3 isoform X3 [Numenius arquata]|uniref:charged multivesicular body protein 3 isoform X3 n=1 Tax=Numenius arquata TaxID=31919 RepID=UPI003D30C74D